MSAPVDISELRLLRTSRMTVRHSLLSAAAQFLLLVENGLDADRLAVEQLRQRKEKTVPLGEEWEQLRQALERVIGAG